MDVYKEKKLSENGRGWVGVRGCCGELSWRDFRVFEEEFEVGGGGCVVGGGDVGDDGEWSKGLAVWSWKGVCEDALLLPLHFHLHLCTVWRDSSETL